eukprot:TRINITY_DN5286_c0_g1_i1.p1 TRINITY_DN5286_c0_g1~~TRINITY_DN5286_c0_g1_i1.p1  ORF type:complete len:172 (+),score=7.39 TRINITY_DN5286_c0_g1_i1:245-760(+)
MSNSQLQDSMVGVKSQKEDDSVDISRCKSLLESKLSEDIKSPVTPKEFSFKDIVKRFDFEQTHSAKLLRKQSGPVSAVSLTNMDEEYCAPSHSHLIRHESLGLRKGRSLPGQIMVQNLPSIVAAETFLKISEQLELFIQYIQERIIKWNCQEPDQSNQPASCEMELLQERY